MKNNDKIKKSIMECIVVISIMALYIVYGIHFLPLLMLIIPLPFVILGVRNGIKSNIISIILTSLIVGLLLGTSSGASLILLFAPLSIALNYSIKMRKTAQSTILITALAFFLSFIILMSFEGTTSNLDVIKQSEQEFTQFLTMQVDVLKEAGMTKYEILQRTDLLENTYKQMIVLIPSFLAMFSLLVGYINLYLASKILRKMGYGTMNIQKFSRFKLPENIIPGVGIMLLSTFIIKRLGIQYHEALLFNITFLVGFAFILQGFSVFDYLLIKAKMKLIFRIILIAINIIFVPISGIMFFIGLADSIFDLRKIRRKKSL